MGFQSVVVHFDEVTGEESDVNEANFLLTFDSTAFAMPLDVHAAFTGRDLTADYGFAALAPTGGDIDIDLEKSTAAPGKYEAVAPKSLFPGVVAPSDVDALTTGAALLVPVPVLPPPPPTP